MNTSRQALLIGNPLQQSVKLDAFLCAERCEQCILVLASNPADAIQHLPAIGSQME